MSLHWAGAVAELRTAVGVLLLLLNVMFFAQPVVMGLVLLSRKHRRLLEQQWATQAVVKQSDEPPTLEVPLLVLEGNSTPQTSPRPMDETPPAVALVNPLRPDPYSS